jgi:hypothetical protein
VTLPAAAALPETGASQGSHRGACLDEDQKPPEATVTAQISLQILGVLGKGVRYQQISFEACTDRFVGFGMPDAMAQAMTDMAWAKNKGLDNGVQQTLENSTRLRR